MVLFVVIRYGCYSVRQELERLRVYLYLYPPLARTLVNAMTWPGDQLYDLIPLGNNTVRTLIRLLFLGLLYADYLTHGIRHFRRQTYESWRIKR
jgi:hypothetical protein